MVTGSSSGIGFETALDLAREGYFTYATMRNTKKGDTIKEIAKKENLKLETRELDVDKEDSVKNAINKIVKEKGRIDILVNNAGYGLFGCLEDISMEELKAQFETNFFGVVRVSQAIIPVMRNQKSGIIVNVSSVAGRIGFPVSPGYISSKFAIEGLSESMRYELSPFGINVIIIEPGVIKTNFMSSTKKSIKSDSAYKDITNKVIMGITMFFQQRLNPPPPDPTQAKMMQFLPIFFTFIFLNFPAGLVLYWIVNNTLSILQQWYITRSVEAGGVVKKKKA